MRNFSLLVESFLKGIKNDSEDLVTFIEKRSSGAKKIQKTAVR